MVAFPSVGRMIRQMAEADKSIGHLDFPYDADQALDDELSDALDCKTDPDTFFRTLSLVAEAAGMLTVVEVDEEAVRKATHNEVEAQRMRVRALRVELDNQDEPPTGA